MDEGFLRWVMVVAAVLGAIATAGSLAFGRADITVGIAVGATLALANLWLLRRLGRRLVSQAGQKAQSGRSTAGLMLAKFGLLIGVIFALQQVASRGLVPINTLALLAGFSVVVLAIVAGTLFGPVPQGEAPENEVDEAGGIVAGTEDS